MTARFSTSAHHGSHCASAAAAGTSVRICYIMDTAYILVVSIFVCLLCLRLWI